jgi:hypothetical protein
MIDQHGFFLLHVNGNAMILNRDVEVVSLQTLNYSKLKEALKPIEIPKEEMTEIPGSKKMKRQHLPKEQQDDDIILMYQNMQDVPVPLEQKVGMESKTVKTTMDEALKVNKVPTADKTKDVWHEFLSRFHAQ